mmetsp:Transcript_17683/g.29499  ORF Transcript_17683/g.29499 Transcript_17683/m.29499 type:complete len:87 (+) Transcript_17683:107-367(+)
MLYCLVSHTKIQQQLQPNHNLGIAWHHVDCDDADSGIVDTKVEHIDTSIILRDRKHVAETLACSHGEDRPVKGAVRDHRDVPAGNT